MIALNTTLPFQLRWVSSVVRGETLTESPSELHPLEQPNTNSNVNRRLDLT